MVELQEKTLESLLNQVKINATKYNQRFYASYTQEMTSTQLVDVFKRARGLEENRSFWHSYSDNFTSVGIGEMAVISSRSEEHTSELQSRFDLVCRLLLEKKQNQNRKQLTR